MATDKYTTEQVIDALRKTRGLISLAATALGCEPQTVRSYVKRYPTVATALREERERMTDIAEASLYQQIKDGQGWAVCFYLKTIGKERGYVERQEVSGPNGDPIAVQYQTSLNKVYGSSEPTTDD